MYLQRLFVEEVNGEGASGEGKEDGSEAAETSCCISTLSAPQFLLLHRRVLGRVQFIRRHPLLAHQLRTRTTNPRKRTFANTLSATLALTSAVSASFSRCVGREVCLTNSGTSCVASARVGGGEGSTYLRDRRTGIGEQ